jgi:hypothetical protein
MWSPALMHGVGWGASRRGDDRPYMRLSGGPPRATVRQCVPDHRNTAMRLSCALFACFATIPLLAQPSPVRDAKLMQVEGVSVPAPPSEHPRLYLRARDIPDLKRRMEHPVLKPVWEQMQAAAKRYPSIRLEVDALRYLAGGDSELGRRTVADALTALESATFDHSIQDITRPIGRLMVTGAVAYDWCYPLLTSEQKDRFLKQFLRLAHELECGYPPPQRGWVTGHGSEWMVMRDMLSAGVAIYDEFPEMYRVAAHRIFRYLAPARNWWYPGGAFHQGTSYSETRFSSDLYPLWIFDRMGAGNVYNPAQQFVPYQWIYMRRPDLQLLRSGDGQSRAPKLRSLLVASYYGDGYVLADYLKQPGVDPMSQLFELLWRDPDLKPREIADLPLARYMGFPYGWMVARTGWGNDSAIAEMKVNVYNFVNHQHLDAGAFQIYYKGPLAVDSGLYEGNDGGYGSPHHVNYAKRTIAHNTLLIYDPEEQSASRPRELRNDGGQRLPNNWREPGTLEDLLNPADGYKTGEVLGQGFGPDPIRPAYAYLKGDITEAYSKKVRQVRRAFVFLNLGGTTRAALIVFDRVVSANAAFKKYWLLHSMEQPAVVGNTSTISLSERGWTGKLVNTTLLPEAGNAEIEKVGGPGKEFWVFGQNFPNQIARGNPKDFEVGAWRVEISPAKASEEDLLLNVLQVMDRGVEKPLPVERLDAGAFVGVRLGDWAVFFNKSADRFAGPVSFSVGAPTSRPATLHCLVTDLAEGSWRVSRNGRVILPAASVTRDSGTLLFDAPAGSFELRALYK